MTSRRLCRLCRLCRVRRVRRVRRFRRLHRLRRLHVLFLVRLPCLVIPFILTSQARINGIFVSEIFLFWADFSHRKYSYERIFL